MLWRDHRPPHFHAKYGEDEVTVEIRTGTVNGTMSNRALKMVQEWRELHIDELLRDWDLAEKRQALFNIQGLE
jgi:hypothetical protein